METTETPQLKPERLFSMLELFRYLFVAEVGLQGNGCLQGLKSTLSLAKDQRPCS
jgi:hypothetical protein